MAACLLAASHLSADTLVYSERNNNPSWSSPDNWFFQDADNKLQPVFHPPVAGDTAIISGSVDALANSIQLAKLILQSNATINNGGFVVGTIQMNGGSGGKTTTFNGSVVKVLNEMDVSGGSCSFDNGSLTIADGAICYIGFGGAGQLSYSGSQIINSGQISLQNTGSFLTGGSNLVNQSGAVISSSTNTVMFGVAGSTFNNSGTVRSDGGAFSIGSFANWPSASGLSKYKATIPGSTILFSSGFLVPANVTNLFSGPGTNILAGTTTIAGTAQVGILLDGTQNLDAGNLEFSGQLGGGGTIHVVALPTTPSTLLVNPNSAATMTAVNLNIDPGGLWLISYVQNSQGVTLLGGVVNNSGSIIWAGASGISMGNGAIINNLPGALFDAQRPASAVNTISGGSLPGGGAINNSGTFRKSSVSVPLIFNVDFNNAGLLDVQGGQVQLASGASSGSFSTVPGSEIWFSGINHTNILAAGANFSGTNFVRAKGGSLLLTGNLSLPNFSLEGGTLDGPGEITVEKLFLWSDGAMQGSGAMSIPAGATANVTGGTFTQRTINNSGSVTMTNSFAAADNAAIFNNLPGGLLQLQSGGGFSFLNTANPHSVLNNFGTLVNTSPTTAPLSFVITNRGSVLLQGNRLNCYQYVQASGTTTIATNATLDSQTAATILFGGLVNGNGTITGSYGVTNSGAILSPGSSPGIFTINNNPYIQTSQGVLNMEIGGPQAGGLYDRLSTPSASLNGILNITLLNGFIPSVGETYPIVSTPFFRAVTGRFSQVTGAHAGHNLLLVPVYGDFGVNLVATTDPLLSAPIRSGTNTILAFPTASGVSNLVEYTDSFTPVNWLLLTNFMGNGALTRITNTTASPHRFYRLEFR